VLPSPGRSLTFSTKSGPQRARRGLKRHPKIIASRSPPATGRTTTKRTNWSTDFLLKVSRRRDGPRLEAFLSKSDRNEIYARLRRLPADFLLALTNATAILVIVAAILALIVMVRIDNLAGRVVTTMTEAVLSKIDLPSKNVLANLRNLTEEVRTLGNTLRDIKVGENPVIQIEIARLKEALTALNASVDRLTNTRTILTDEAIAQLGRAVTDTLTQMRGCTSKVGQMQPSLNAEGATLR
jgi:hypothetical protein